MTILKYLTFFLLFSISNHSFGQSLSKEFTTNIIVSNSSFSIQNNVYFSIPTDCSQKIKQYSLKINDYPPDWIPNLYLKNNHHQLIYHLESLHEYDNPKFGSGKYSFYLNFSKNIILTSPLKDKIHFQFFEYF